MGPVFFVVAILGCGDGQADCREARVDPVRFATAAQCQAALPTVIARHTDLDYPTIAGACRVSGPVMARADQSARPG